MTQMLILTKQPTESQMALSAQVKEALKQAEEHLREALAFAARSEHSVTVGTIADLLARCESVESMDEFMQRFTSKSSEESGNEYKR